MRASARTFFEQYTRDLTPSDFQRLFTRETPDAYRYFARLARDYKQPADIWLFGTYPTFSFYRFDDRAIRGRGTDTQEDEPGLGGEAAQHVTCAARRSNGRAACCRPCGARHGRRGMITAA